MVCLGALQTSFLETHDLTVFGSKHLDPGPSHNTRAPVLCLCDAGHLVDPFSLKNGGSNVNGAN